MRIFEAFAGYGSQSLALERLHENFPKFNYEVVGISEIDKYAVQAYNAIHGNVKNWGDVTAIDWTLVPDFDLLTWSSPCQDISNAGKGKGMTEGSGTRSSLLWEVKKPIEAKRPKYILFENVKNFIGENNRADALRLFSMLEGYGYTVFYKVMNAKDYGVPQNRERIFILAIDGDDSYEFPQGFPLEQRLKDVLEEDVAEKYYLKKSVIQKLIPAEIYGNKRVQKLVESGKITGKEIQFIDAYNQSVNDNIAGTIRTTIDSSSMHFISEPQILTPKRTEYGKLVRKEYESGNIKESRHNMTEMMPREDGISNTLTSVQKDNLVVEPSIKQYPLGLKDSLEYRDGYASTITTNSSEHNNFVVKTLRIPEATKKGYTEVNPGCVFDAAYPNSKTRRGRVQGEGRISPTLTAGDRTLCYYDTDFRIRKLTPRECFRLMDMDDKYIDRIQSAGISNSQQYKLAGNSIVVACLYYIFKNLFIGFDKTKLF